MNQAERPRLAPLAGAGNLCVRSAPGRRRLRPLAHHEKFLGQIALANGRPLLPRRGTTRCSNRPRPLMVAPKPMTRRKRISISDEMSLAMHAIEGANQVAERIVESAEPAEARRLSHVVQAILVVTRERLRMLEHAIRNEVDPS